MKVLIVDAEDICAQLNSCIVEKYGHEAVVFRSAEDFLASDLDGDVVLVNNQLHGVNGEDMLRELWARNRQIPTVMITDPMFLGLEEWLVALDRLAVKGIVVKPHSIQDVLDLLKHAVTYQGRLLTKSPEQMLHDLNVKGRSF